jgi:O-antigen/teichoic acid export membrane protein
MPGIKKNIIYQSIYQLMLTLLPLVTAPYISRVLGAENIGINAYTLSIATYFSLFALLGIVNHGSRAIAAARNNPEKLNATFSNLLFIHIVASLFVSAAYVVFVLLFAGEFKLFFTVQSLIVLSALFDISWLYIGLEKFKLVVIRNAVVKIISIACVFIFVKSENDLWIYILIMAAGTFVGQAAVWIFIKKFISFVKPTHEEIKRHIKPILILFIPVIATSVYSIMNKIMLGAMTDKMQLGFFENSYKIVAIPMGLVTALNAVIIPRMASINASGDQAARKKLTLILMKYVILLAFAVAFGIAAIAYDFAPLFFGQEFKDVGIIIATLCIMIPFYAFSNSIAAQYLIPCSKDKSFAFAAVVGAVISVATNLILIPRFAAMGAAIAVILAESSRFVIIALMSRKALPIWLYIKNCFPFLFFGIAMFFLVRFIGNFMARSIITILIQVAIGTVFYLSVSAIYMYKTKDEIFVSYFKKRR